MVLGSVIQIIKPEPDSHFRLSACRCCRGDNVGYVKYLDKGRESWRARCFDCGYTVKPQGAGSRHDVQMVWNGIVGQQFASGTAG